MSEEKKKINWNGSWEDLVGEYSFLRTNKYILKGYRIGLKFKDCIWSLVHLTNESINIWSHLVGIFLVLICGLHCYFLNVEKIHSKDYSPHSFMGPTLVSKGHHDFSMMAIIIKPEILSQSIHIDLDKSLSKIYYKCVNTPDILNNDDFNTIRYLFPQYMNLDNNELRNISQNILKTDLEEYVKDELSHSFSKPIHTPINFKIPKYPIYIFLFSAFICLFCSSFYHCYNCINEEAHTLYKKFDYIGISILIAGSYYPIIIYSFYCNIKTQLFYLFPITIICLSVLYLSLSEYGLSPNGIILRTFSYMCSGFQGLIPLTHIILKYGINSENYLYSCPGLIKMGLWYCFGAVLYAFKIPERFYPGKYDYFGSSHQIFHICVVIAVMIHYYTCYWLYNWMCNIESVICSN